MSKLYRGISGTKYKYDLNNPMDKLDYLLDVDAQLNDKLNSIDSNVQFDKAMGQNGGSIIVDKTKFSGIKLDETKFPFKIF